MSWIPDLIVYNNDQVYGIPTYHALKMFAEHRGDTVVELETQSERQLLDYPGMPAIGAAHPGVSCRNLSVNGVPCTEIYNVPGYFQTMGEFKMEGDVFVSVSDNAYIGADKARAIALSHAGLEESQVHDLHTDFDVEHGTMVYEVEFRTAADEYEYEIDAVTGNILDFSREAEKSKDPAPTASPAPQTDIGADKARDIALKHAGVSASGITELDIERENKDGRLIYSVEFRVGTGEYEYEISAADGSILSYDIDVRETPAAASGTDIGAEAARRIALSHANVSESSLDEIEAESKISDGRLEYKIKFTSGTTEYKYVIDGATGSILDCDMETHETETVHQSGKVISAEKAKDIALKHADIKSKLDWVTVGSDEEDGQLIYSIEFAVGGIEYEYEVDASSGSILSWDSEQAETEYSKDNDKKDKDGDDHDDEDDD